jgi:hypothetical protein
MHSVFCSKYPQFGRLHGMAAPNVSSENAAAPQAARLSSITKVNRKAKTFLVFMALSPFIHDSGSSMPRLAC